MAKQVLNNGETHGSIRTKVNDNFTEVYSHMAESAAKHIKESGSNANGNYIRFDDGTMICHAKLRYTCSSVVNENGWYRATLVVGGGTSKPFPSAFIDVPRVITSRAYDNAIEPYTLLINVSNANYCIVTPLHTAAFTDITIVFDYIAIGRWKA